MADSIINTRRTDQLTYNDTLRAVDYKGTCLRHQGKIPHKNLMFTDLFFFFIIEAHCHGQGRRIGSIPLLALLNRIFYIILAQLKIHKLKAQGTAVVGNGRDIIKSFLQSFVKKPLIRILLYLKQIGHLQDLFLPRIAHAHNLGTGNWTYSVFLH